MLIKSADSKESQITILQNLLSEGRFPPEKRQLIERELRNILTGVATEKQAAFEIDFYAERTKNLFVIHDLRLEIGGRVAQIDHLLMNRALEVYVLETKTFGTGLSINDQGEFSTSYDGKEIGIPSPIEQNARHISVLKDAFREISLPKRLGITLQPSFNSVILVSPKAVINRSKTNNFDASIIKLDQFFSWYHGKMNTMVLKDAIRIFNICSSETIARFGEKLLSLHKPVHASYIKKFDLESVSIGNELPRSVHVEPKITIDSTALKSKEEIQYFCASCKASIASVVAKYCWSKKERFSGKAYCRYCQTKI